LFLFLVLSVPLFVGAVALVNRSTSDRDELEQLKQRVDELESDRN
jgi:hypothetical protein